MDLAVFDTVNICIGTEDVGIKTLTLGRADAVSCFDVEAAFGKEPYGIGPVVLQDYRLRRCWPVGERGLFAFDG